MNPVLSKFLHVARCNDLQHGSVAIVEPSFWKRLRHEPWLLLSSVSMQHLFRNPHTISSCSKYTLWSLLDSRYITRQLQLQLHGSSDGVLWCGRTTQEPVLSREKCPHCFNPAFRLHFHH